MKSEKDNRTISWNFEMVYSLISFTGFKLSALWVLANGSQYFIQNMILKNSVLLTY